MKSYQLHSADDRRDLFARLSPRNWLESDLMRVWVVTEPATILRIFRHPLAVVSSPVDIIKAIKQNYGVELPNIAYACGVLPLLVADDAHPAMRRGFATFLAARLAELDAELPELSRRTLAALAKRRRVDIVSEVVAPFINRIFSVFLQCPLPPWMLSTHVGDVLSFNTTLSRLKDIEGRIARTLAFLRETTGNDDDIAWKFCCLVFGLDSLSMMLTEGIVAVLRDGQAEQTPARLPAFPVETGLPLTFRRAKADFVVDDCAFKAGDLIRLQLQVLGYSELAEQRPFIFGSGVHSCIGKQLSLRVWENFKREFDRLDLRACVVNYQLAPSHYIVLHKVVEVEVR